MEQWDDLLVKLATNIVATPRTGKKPDVKKMRAFDRATKESETPISKRDPKAFLAAVKQRQN